MSEFWFWFCCFPSAAWRVLQEAWRTVRVSRQLGPPRRKLQTRKNFVVFGGRLNLLSCLFLSPNSTGSRRSRRALVRAPSSVPWRSCNQHKCDCVFLWCLCAGTRRVTHCKGRRCPSAPSNELSCRIQPLYFSIFHFSRLTMTCVSPFDLSTPPLCLHSWSPSLAFLAPPPLRPSPLHLVTMQIYLSPLARKTGSSEAAASAAAARADRGPAATPVKTPRPNESRKATPSFTLNLQKSSQSSTQDISSYKSPTKSPSQYFQICYWHLGPNVWMTANSLRFFNFVDHLVSLNLWFQEENASLLFSCFRFCF